MQTILSKRMRYICKNEYFNLSLPTGLHGSGSFHYTAASHYGTILLYLRREEVLYSKLFEIEREFINLSADERKIKREVSRTLRSGPGKRRGLSKKRMEILCILSIGNPFLVLLFSTYNPKISRLEVKALS